MQNLDHNEQNLSEEESVLVESMTAEEQDCLINAEEELPSIEEEKTQHKKPKTVPHGAFHEEREQRKKAQAHLTELKTQLQELYKVIEEQKAPDSQVDDQIDRGESLVPDPEKDPKAFMEYLANQQKNLLAQEQQKKQEKALAQQDKILSDYLSQAIEMAKKDRPDFFDASNFLYQQRYKQLKALGGIYNHLQSDSEINQQIGLELRQLIEGAIQKEQDPTAMLYEIAQGMGYQSQKDDKISYKEEALEAFNAKSAATKTLVAHNGKYSAEPYSLEAIHAMSEAEFSNWIAKPENELIFQRLLGNS